MLKDIFNHEGPVMNFINTITDLIILNLLFVICSIPIVTFGAAYSAKYYVAMKIVRGEEPKIIGPFFKAFKQNFRQSTLAWIIYMVLIALLALDWRWIVLNGWNQTPFAYKLGAVFMTVFVWLMLLSTFPIISRYEMSNMELFKASFTVAIIRFIPLALITIFMAGSVIVSVWYMQWFPLIAVFCSLTVTYFMSLIFIKQFDKLENKQGSDDGNEEDEVLKPITDSEPEDGMMTYAESVKELHKEIEADSLKEDEIKVEDTSGNKLTRYIRNEKKKLKDLNGKQRFAYFMQYYFPGTMLLILVIVAAVWYGHDVYRSKLKVITGGLINCSISDEGQEFATDGFLKWAGYPSKRTAYLDATDLNFESDVEFEEQYMEVALRAQVYTGAFDYLILREDAVDNYVSNDSFEDLSTIVDLERFDKSDIYYFNETETNKYTGTTKVTKIPLALRLNDKAKENLGLDKQYDYYIAFAYQMGFSSSYDVQAKFTDYLFELA